MAAPPQELASTVQDMTPFRAWVRNTVLDVSGIDPRDNIVAPSGALSKRSLTLVCSPHVCLSSCFHGKQKPAKPMDMRVLRLVVGGKVAAELQNAKVRGQC
jgi:hypothetical protein